jgi:hypothetical protein
VAASSALLLALGSDLTFFGDTWAFLLGRDGPLLDDLLLPHNEHIVVLPVALQELTIELFGTTSDMSSRVLLTAMLAGTAILLFVYVRRRIGAWPALFAAAILLFLGSGWENLLWPFQISLVGSVLTGLGMLLALERADRRGDLAACVLLTVSIASSSLGVSFAVGALADVVLRRRERGLRRAWVALGPLALYGAWYLGYGRDAESAVSLGNLVSAPLFVLESAAASAASILGLRALGGGIDAGMPAGPMIAVGLLAAAALAWAIRRHPDALRRAIAPGRGSPLWPAVATALTFWLLAGLNEAPGRSPFASRYMYVGAVLLLILAADLLAGARIGRRALAVAGIVTAFAIGANVHLLQQGHDRLEAESVLTKADLAALEIAPAVDPAFWLEPEFAGTTSLVNVSAGPYLELVDEHGSPAYTEAELAGAPVAARIQADLVLAHALPISISGAAPPPEALAARRCRSLRPGVDLLLPPGATYVELSVGPTATLFLGRFSPAGVNPVFHDVAGGGLTRLSIPPDRSDRRWRLSLEADRAARVCSPRG